MALQHHSFATTVQRLTASLIGTTSPLALLFAIALVATAAATPVAASSNEQTTGHTLWTYGFGSRLEMKLGRSDLKAPASIALVTGQRHWGALLGLVTPHRGQVAAMGLVLSVVGVLPLLGPLLIAKFIDSATSEASQPMLLSLAAAYIGLGITRQLMAVVVARTAAELAWQVTNELRSSLARHVLDLHLGFHRASSPGELVSRVDGDVTAVSEFISQFAVKAIATSLTLVGLVVVIIVREPAIGVGLTGYLLIAVTTLYQLRDKAVEESATEQATLGRLLGEVEERLAGADDLRSNGGGSHAVATFQRASAALLRSSLGRERQSVLLWITSNAVFAWGGLLMLAISAALLRNGTITLGTAYLLFQYTQVMRKPLNDLAKETEQVQRAAGGMSRTLQLLGTESAIVDEGTATLPPGPLDLEIGNVTFEYRDEETPTPVVAELSIGLTAGRSLGVLGRTGSGKTTLARLILRLIEPTDGTIKLGGIRLDDVGLADLRARCGVVSQEVHLFAASIRDNITLFDDTVSDDDVQQALASLDLLNWVEDMPQALDTELGPSGAGLSAGEAQLIALARLFLRSPDLIVLDEASARIDPATEARVTHAIDRLLEGRTALVIAHRLSTVERLDEIAIIDNGRIVEHGPTATLATDANSAYRALLTASADV